MQSTTIDPHRNNNVGPHHTPRYDSSTIMGSRTQSGVDQLMGYFPDTPFQKPEYPPPYVVKYLMSDEFDLLPLPDNTVEDPTTTRGNDTSMQFYSFLQNYLLNLAPIIPDMVLCVPVLRFSLVCGSFSSHTCTTAFSLSLSPLRYILRPSSRATNPIAGTFIPVRSCSSRYITRSELFSNTLTSTPFPPHHTPHTVKVAQTHTIIIYLFISDSTHPHPHTNKQTNNNNHKKNDPSSQMLRFGLLLRGGAGGRLRRATLAATAAAPDAISVTPTARNGPSSTTTSGAGKRGRGGRRGARRAASPAADDGGAAETADGDGRPAYMTEEAEKRVLKRAKRMQDRDLSGEDPVPSFVLELLKKHPSVRRMGVRERVDFACSRWDQLSTEERKAYVSNPLKEVKHVYWKPHRNRSVLSFFTCTVNNNHYSHLVYCFLLRFSFPFPTAACGVTTGHAFTIDIRR
eukprot:gene9801-6878_t